MGVMTEQDLQRDALSIDQPPLTVLVVEDSITVRRLVRLVLEERGHVVIEADTADAAIEAAERYAPNVIVLDLNLASTRSGASIAPILKSVAGEAAILVYSGHLPDRLSLAGVDDALSKEEPLAALADRVESLGRSGSTFAS